jgi:hypothetical protein
VRELLGNQVNWVIAVGVPFIVAVLEHNDELTCGCQCWFVQQSGFIPTALLKITITDFARAISLLQLKVFSLFMKNAGCSDSSGPDMFKTKLRFSRS